jgi:hypothetical protein
MDEILFVNEYTRDKSTAKDIYGYWCFKRPISVFLYIMSGIFLLGYIRLISIGYWPELWEMMVILFIIIYSPLRYFVLVDRMVKKDAEIGHGKPIRMVLSVSQDKIFIGNPADEYFISFDAIKYAFQITNYVVCVTKSSRSLLMFKKDSFTLGDVENFLAFIRKAGVKVRGKKN